MIQVTEISMKLLIECFMDTVAMGTIGGFMLIFGTLQLIMYLRHATEIDTQRIRKSRLYNFQLFLLVLLQKMTEKCFKKCVGKPGQDLDGSEQVRVGGACRPA